MDIKIKPSLSFMIIPITLLIILISLLFSMLFPAIKNLVSINEIPIGDTITLEYNENKDVYFYLEMSSEAEFEISANYNVLTVTVTDFGLSRSYVFDIESTTGTFTIEEIQDQKSTINNLRYIFLLQAQKDEEYIISTSADFPANTNFAFSETNPALMVLQLVGGIILSVFTFIIMLISFLIIIAKRAHHRSLLIAMEEEKNTNLFDDDEDDFFSQYSNLDNS